MHGTSEYDKHCTVSTSLAPNPRILSTVKSIIQIIVISTNKLIFFTNHKLCFQSSNKFWYAVTNWWLNSSWSFSLLRSFEAMKHWKGTRTCRPSHCGSNSIGIFLLAWNSLTLYALNTMIAFDDVKGHLRGHRK